MAAERHVIEVDEYPELVRLVNEVRTLGSVTILRQNGKDVAILEPLESSTRRRRRVDPEKLRDALLATAGGWKDIVDTDQLIADIYAARDLPQRPLPEL